MRATTLYDGEALIVAVGLKNLREHGPAGPVFWLGAALLALVRSFSSTRWDAMKK